MVKGDRALRVGVATLAVALASQAHAGNLIVNGNFSAGDIGFSSGYVDVTQSGTPTPATNFAPEPSATPGTPGMRRPTLWARTPICIMTSGTTFPRRTARGTTLSSTATVTMPRRQPGFLDVGRGAGLVRNRDGRAGHLVQVRGAGDGRLSSDTRPPSNSPLTASRWAPRLRSRRHGAGLAPVLVRLGIRAPADPSP